MSSDNDDYTAFKKTLNESNNQFIRKNTKDIDILNTLSLNGNSDLNTIDLDNKQII